MARVSACSGIAAALAAMSGVPAQAATQPGALTFHEAVELAWQRLPQLRDLQARRRIAEVQYGAGGTLFPDAPYITGNYFDDRVAGSREGFITSQGEVGTPVWLPGEGTATQNAARADAVTIAAEEPVERLSLAGRMLALVRRAAIAADEADVAGRHAALAARLAAGLHESVAVGETAESDSLAADAELAQARITLTRAETDREAATAELQLLTGIGEVPVLSAPPAPPVTPALLAAMTVTPDVAQAIAGHPRIAAAARAVAAAEARAKLVRIENRDDPQIGLQVINEKQYGSPWDTRIGVMVHFPFATYGRNAPKRAQAEAEVTRAEVQLDQAQRDVLAAIRRSAAQLSGAEQANADSAHAAAALDRRRAQVDHAWRLGEMPLIEVVRANSMAFEADLAAETARTDREAARLELRIALGELP